MSGLGQLVEYAPKWAIVAGSGLDAVGGSLEVSGSLVYAEVPELPVPTVQGHAGNFTWGRLGGQRVVVARGRVHLYEGFSAQEVTAGMRWLKQIGVRRVILTNAAGSIHAGHGPGQWMAITDQLNLTGTSPLLGGPNFVEMNEIYTRKWREHFGRAAEEEGVTLHQGVYAGLVGPQYETPAEVRMLRTLSADAVGMSTVLEAIQARALGMEVVGFSCLTNWAAGLAETPLSHEGVLATGRSAGAILARVLERGMRRV